jgi:hypothetical protein
MLWRGNQTLMPAKNKVPPEGVCENGTSEAVAEVIKSPAFSCSLS